MQFYAIEIARYVDLWCICPGDMRVSLPSRNRNGLNDWIFERKHETAETTGGKTT
jgi:hypothetical protein